jgi:ABC-type sugar transport system ATPase subunit
MATIQGRPEPAASSGAPVDSRQQTEGNPLLKLRGVSKYYGHVRALENVDFELYSGEVLALVGDNGAGKSTLIKIISGAIIPDRGEIFLDGNPARIRSPQDAVLLGIMTVYQHLALIDTRDVLANLFLGREPSRWGMIDRRKMQEDAGQVLSELGIMIPSLTVPVGILSGGQRQAVAIGRALLQGSRIIIMDEPTAALGVEETRRVLELTEKLRARGLSLIMISHNLHHVFSVADRITVLRGGRKVGVRRRSETTGEEIVRLITGVELIGEN